MALPPPPCLASAHFCPRNALRLPSCKLHLSVLKDPALMFSWTCPRGVTLLFPVLRSSRWTWAGETRDRVEGRGRVEGAEASWGRPAHAIDAGTSSHHRYMFRWENRGQGVPAGRPLQCQSSWGAPQTPDKVTPIWVSLRGSSHRSCLVSPFHSVVTEIAAAGKETLQMFLHTHAIKIKITEMNIIVPERITISS